MSAARHDPPPPTPCPRCQLSERTIVCRLCKAPKLPPTPEVIRAYKIALLAGDAETLDALDRAWPTLLLLRPELRAQIAVEYEAAGSPDLPPLGEIFEADLRRILGGTS